MLEVVNAHIEVDAGIRDCNHRENHVHSLVRRHAKSRAAILRFFEDVTALRLDIVGFCF